MVTYFNFEGFLLEFKNSIPEGVLREHMKNTAYINNMFLREFIYVD